ncbi:F-box/kelch-repeat protein At3g06240-like [Silene latifolia]|uniref:F-box/kelch-repeat protein At3g06240-like n=1 Tax=Silene latifolia TaxID=37657 RepID=UPI003D786977
MIFHPGAKPDYNVRCFLICNPTTRTFKSILPCSERKWTDSGLLYGFGYDIEHDDYKIIVTKFVFAEDDRPVCIYSLKTGLWSWTDLPTSVSTGRCNWTIIGEAIYVNNMLHYLVTHEYKYFKIARFDIVSEKWRDDLNLPVQVSGYVQFGNLDGRLFLNVGEYKIVSSDVWMMEEYGSWKKMFHFSLDLFGRCPIARSKDGCDHRLLIRDEGDDTAEFFWYDQRDNTRIPFKLERSGRTGLYELCIASLVAIPGGCSLTKLQQLEDGA